MANFWNSESFQLSFYGSIIFGLGTCLCFLQKFKQNLQKDIESIEKLKIHEVTSLNNLKKDIKSLQMSEKDNIFFLIKAKSQNIQFLKTNPIECKIDIYSNQIYFCPPSLDKIFDDQVEKYQKQMKYKNMIISTSKFQCQTDFKPRQKPQIQDLQIKNISGKIKSLLQSGGQLFYKFRENFWYFAQKSLEFFYRKKQQRRSNNKKRMPFFKGVGAGLLIVKFNLLKYSYYVLKINVQGSRVYCDIIADNKLGLIQPFKKMVNQQAACQILILPIILFAAFNFTKLIKHKVKKIWFNMITFNKKILNPSGISDDKLCQICYANCRNVLFYNCRHFIVCDDCYQHLDKETCIICNHFLQKAQPLYMISK